MKWKYWMVVLIALLSSAMLVLESMLTRMDTLVGFFMAFISLFLIFISIDFVKNRYKPEIISVQRHILNSCARNAFEITTIGEFILESEEEALKADDEVHILTNSLDSYDATPPAVRVIANNLADGVNYIYYLSKEFPALSKEKDELVGRVLAELKGGVLKERPELAKKVVEDNLIFYIIEEECIYNFAIVKAGGTVKGYWYITTPSPPNKKTPNLVILELNQDLRDQLYKIFERLSKSKKVSALAKGL